MISRFFIHRPIFASVISIVVVIAGLAAMRALPVAQYPDIVPPSVQITAYYPGASAEVISQTVAAPLEQAVNGVDNMLYIGSSASAGSLSIAVTFAIGTDPDQATINVNNRVQSALPQLPEEVRRWGVNVVKNSANFLQIVMLDSADARYDTVFISNYALVNVLDELRRIPGVGNAQIFGARDYSMRVWLRPDRLAQFGLTPADVAAAIREQNSQFAAGKFGQAPMHEAQEFTYTVTTQGRLVEPEEFAAIILRADADGSVLRLGDVARVELGAADYGIVSKRNGHETVAIGIFLAPGANALATATAVSERMAALAKRFPAGLQYTLPYDTTKFVEVSIREVAKTLAEAMGLVFLVVYLFLQSARATIIPFLAVPVSLIGTFAGMYLLGFSVNTLTLFGMVLAIGIVVDDAIVVLENVERIMRTEGLGPRAATLKAMEEVSGPVIAIVLVLCAVFVPVGFAGGLAGQMYKQFAITIAVSVVLSGLVALTLTPALCATLLKPGHHEPNAFFRGFNRFFEHCTAGYAAGVRFFLRRALLGVGLFVAMLVACWGLFSRVPGSLVPDEDQGYIMTMAILPPAASVERTVAVSDRIDAIALANPAIENIISLSGLDLLSFSNSSFYAAAFLTLKPWEERRAPGQDAQSLVGQMFMQTAAIRDALVLAFNPPPISGMSTTGGFEAYVQSRGGAGSQALAGEVGKLVAAAHQRPELAGVQTVFNASVPQINVRLDREKARTLGVPVSQVFDTMQATFGSLYVNDFNKLGRTFKVQLQSEAEFRARPDDLRNVFVRSARGEMIPLTALVTIEQTVGAEVVERYNVFPSAKVVGGPAPGYSSGQAIAAMEEIAAQVLGEDYALAWTASAYQERVSGGTSYAVFGFGLVMVFLILAALYERWTLPFAVVLAVPFALFGALLAVWARGLANDVYFQIGLVTLIGLAAKNAILIVEFAVLKVQEGKPLMEAAIEAARLRFRPIIMTSLAFVLGVVPLAFSTGAGAASRHSIGTGVIGGMLAATFIATFFIPLFFRLIVRHLSKDEAAHMTRVELDHV
ncbi:HAE1 family hydrophobic/amphiphilic exporter-1/multidrug efflux pump [Plasticicumulans lactativorans]|uniref:Efflux pump membrane transporter n=1 Tax=Plasticicumulans lactativorans TaxID=1133106 RepID=A0A4R2KZU8_9GAMM|nr:multidrug efflux RND transporter permease subunit [Plasticicumulans lactativorans]TCO80251.1 HAE1 family hydrophobic/amphiphilic exporter-1/multidrug efflux pump [Plasticicumulans lactativorans]